MSDYVNYIIAEEKIVKENKEVTNIDID